MSKKLVKKSRTDATTRSAILRRASIRPPGSNEDFLVAKNLTLYRYVYSSTLSFVCVFVLLSSLLMQGFYVAYADELDTSLTDSITTSEISDSEITEDPSEEPSEESDLEIVEESSEDTEIIETEPENPVIDMVNDLAIDEVEEEGTEGGSELVSVGIGGELIVDIENSTTTSSSSETVEEVVDSSEQSTTTNETENTPSSEENEPVEINEEVEIATTSEIAATTTHESISYVQSDDALTFSEDDCTKLADGSFYCKEINENLLKDALFSARDKNGDLEIFLVREGKQAQITENSVDDASPYFDEISNTIVWQRLIDDRFQIIEYSLETGEEMQITDGVVNNMEPTRQGGYTVWQRWIGDSWNIVLYDGLTEKEITHDSNHNIAPHIQGSLVVWNKTSVGGDKTIEMYNIDSGAYVTVNDPEGLAVDNPRMVLVYDSLHPNGDVITKGFDIFTGEFIQLDTLPKSLPDIPDSETTTEVKALTQPKPELKLNLENKLPEDDFDNDVIIDLDLSTGNEVATSTEMTLDLSQSTSTENIELEESEVIPDLIIPPFTETASSIGTSTSGV